MDFLLTHRIAFPFNEGASVIASLFTQRILDSPASTTAAQLIVAVVIIAIVAVIAVVAAITAVTAAIRTAIIAITAAIIIATPTPIPVVTHLFSLLLQITLSYAGGGQLVNIGISDSFGAKPGKKVSCVMCRFLKCTGVARELILEE